MHDILGKSWWALAVRGVAAVVFGILALIWPAHTVVALVTLFGVYAFIDGIFALVSAFRAVARHLHWMALVAEGILGVVIGVLTFIHPGFTAQAFIYFIAFWAVVTGLLEVYAAFRLRSELEGEMLLILAGTVSLVFGVLLFKFPAAGALTLIWILGIYALMFGVLLIALSLRLRARLQGGTGNAPSSAQGPA